MFVSAVCKYLSGEKESNFLGVCVLDGASHIGTGVIYRQKYSLISLVNPYYANIFFQLIFCGHDKRQLHRRSFFFCKKTLIILSTLPPLLTSLFPKTLALRPLASHHNYAFLILFQLRILFSINSNKTSNINE